MNARSNILTRIHAALTTPAPEPDPAPPGCLFDPIGPAQLLTRLESELIALKAQFHRSADWADAHAWVKAVADKNELRRVVAAPDADAAMAGRAVEARILSGNGDCGKNLADVDLGITACDCLVARTGSVVLTARSGFGRVLSVLPHSHLVVARRPQVVADLTDAFRLLQGRHVRAWPSMLTFITGPSRTADIEKILVMGAHGPRNLFVLLLDF